MLGAGAGRGWAGSEALCPLSRHPDPWAAGAELPLSSPLPPLAWALGA